VAQESPVTVFEDARGPNVRVLRQAQRRLSPAELERLIADYEAGARVCELAKDYGLHRTTVAGHVARAGKTRPVMTEAQIDEAVTLYGDGGRCTTWVSAWGLRIRRSGGCWWSGR
jgi:hypothetical protein